MRFRTGGQTGVDRAALDSLLQSGFPVGGWCPKGRLAEDGRIPHLYPLQESGSETYADRTWANVRDSDATLIIHFGPLKGGTRLTRQFCQKAQKPYLLIDGDEIAYNDGAQTLIQFLGDHAIEELNIAGPRASEAPQAYGYTYSLLEEWAKRALPGTVE